MTQDLVKYPTLTIARDQHHGLTPARAAFLGIRVSGCQYLVRRAVHVRKPVIELVPDPEIGQVARDGVVVVDHIDSELVVLPVASAFAPHERRHLLHRHPSLKAIVGRMEQDDASATRHSPLESSLRELSPVNAVVVHKKEIGLLHQGRLFKRWRSLLHQVDREAPRSLQEIAAEGRRSGPVVVILTRQQ